ncbi:hypothetical protein quinque_010299 [Culex quinquefasciatus]
MNEEHYFVEFAFFVALPRLFFIFTQAHTISSEPYRSYSLPHDTAKSNKPEGESTSSDHPPRGQDCRWHHLKDLDPNRSSRECSIIGRL